jgi:hypothetical protein
LTDFVEWQQPKNLIAYASYGLASVDAKKYAKTGVSPTGTKCVDKGAISSITSQNVGDVTSSNACYSTFKLPDLKAGIHRILYGWPFEHPKHGAGRMYYDLIHIKIEGGGSGQTQGNQGIGLTSFTQQQIDTQYQYWQQLPFESKVSNAQWLAAITPKGKSGPEAPSCHYSMPPTGRYKMSVCFKIIF